MHSSNASRTPIGALVLASASEKSKVSNVESDQRVVAGTNVFHVLLNNAARAVHVLPGFGTTSGRQVEQAMSCA